MKRFLTLLALGAVLTACSEQLPTLDETAPSFAATSEWTETLVDYGNGDPALSWPAACVDDFLMEAGTGLRRKHIVTTANGTLITVQWQQLADYHLVGVNTGTWNQSGPTKGERTERKSTANGSWVGHYTYNSGFVNATSGVKIIVEFGWTFTRTANGVWTVDRFVDKCHVAGTS